MFTRLAAYVQTLPRNGRPILLTTLYGLCAGLAAVIFEVGINQVYAQTYLRFAKWSHAGFMAGSFVMIVVTSLIAGFLLSRFCPEAAGSGIPQLKLAFWKDFGYVPAKVVWVKFVAGILTVGGGASLGREGPTVQLAGGAASQLAGRLGIAKNGRRLAAACGAAAGLAAAFNAPLASITFVLEEIIEDLNSRMLGSILYAAVLGALVVHAFLGSQPAFSLRQIDVPTWRGYLLSPLAATLASVAGVVFQVGALGIRRGFKHRRVVAKSARVDAPGHRRDRDVGHRRGGVPAHGATSAFSASATTTSRWDSTTNWRGNWRRSCWRASSSPRRSATARAAAGASSRRTYFSARWWAWR